MLNDTDALHKNSIAHKNIDIKECVVCGFINIRFKNYDGNRVGNRYISQGGNCWESHEETSSED